MLSTKNDEAKRGTKLLSHAIVRVATLASFAVFFCFLAAVSLNEKK